MAQSPPPFPSAVSLHPLKCHIFLSICPVVFTGILVIATFACNMCFWQVIISQKELKRKQSRQKGRSLKHPTIHLTSFCILSTADCILSPFINLLEEFCIGDYIDDMWWNLHSVLHGVRFWVATSCQIPYHINVACGADG
jgi:hypothetical protein